MPCLYCTAIPSSGSALSVERNTELHPVHLPSLSVMLLLKSQEDLKKQQTFDDVIKPSSPGFK